MKVALKKFSDVEKLSWFPGHMKRGMDLLKSNIKNMDVFIEIRDSRIPFTSLNKNIDDILRVNQKKKIVIFNKYDLCQGNITLKFVKNLNDLGIPSFVTSTKTKVNLDQIIKKSLDVKHYKYSTVGQWLMIGGFPNIGKSSIINQIRTESKKFKTGKVSKTSPLPCMTKSSVGFKVSENPNSFLIDTPGILLPKIQDLNMILKLGLIGCIKDRIIGKDILVEYLTEIWTKSMREKIIKKYNLEIDFYDGYDLTIKLREKLKLNDLETTQNIILDDFRNGRFGLITLDNLNELLDIN